MEYIWNYDAVLYEYSKGSTKEQNPYCATFLFSIRTDTALELINKINTKEEFFKNKPDRWQLEKVFYQTLKSVTNNIYVSDYIANDISAVEFKDRIDTVEKRVINADPATKDLFKQWYPSITDKDLVAYFLNPTQTIDKLKAKTTAAEIGSAFTGQGLTTNQSSAEGFAAYGIDRAGALTGAAQIAEVLPTSNKLSNIYGETGINYTQATGESEFLKTNQKAAEQRRQLKSLERAKFSGDSGTSQQFSSVNKSVQGAF
jgi:hypothetical protein